MKVTRNNLINYLNISEEKADEIIGLISGNIDFKSYKSVENWINQLVNPITDNSWDKSFILTAINEVLENYGVEALRGNYINTFYGDCQAEYSNTGDTYIDTIIYDNLNERFIIDNVGDFVEKNDEKFGL